MQKRKFYVIAHNPNTLQLAEDFLRAGANALGPDVKYANGQYYISHDEITEPLGEERKLDNYLTGLKNLVTANRFNLALIAFDVKDPAFDVNDFLRIVYRCYLQYPLCNATAILVSTAKLEDAGFIKQFIADIPNTGVGIDEHNEPAEVLQVLQQTPHLPIAYGNGITTLLPKPGLFYSISEAKFLQAQGNSFKLVMVWVLANENSMRSYLHLGIDAILVDRDETDLLLRILKEPDFEQRFELAHSGYNPWQAAPLPAYRLTIKTSNKILAGTGAAIRFHLQGSEGGLETTVDTWFDKMMERDSLNHVVLEGINIGIIKSLTLELLEGGPGSAWLPEYIKIESSLHKTVLVPFAEDEWIKGNTPVNKAI